MKRLIPYCAIILALSAPLRYRCFAAAKPGKPAAAEKAGDKKPKVVPKKAKQTAGDLVKDMRAGIVATGKAAKGVKPDVLNPKLKQHAVFFTALKKADKATQDLEKAIAAKDAKALALIDQAGAPIVQLEDAVRMLRIKNSKITKPVRAASMAFNELRTNFGRLAVRKKQGGELSDKEKANAAKLQAESKKQVAKLKGLHDKAKAKKNARLTAELDALIHHYNRIDDIKAAASLVAYLELLESINYLNYEWTAFGAVSQVWYPDVYTEWSSINTGFQSWYVSYEADVSVYVTTDAAWYETSVDVVDSTSYYGVSVTEAEYASSETYLASYEESSATETYSAEELTEEETDTETYDEETYNLEDDDDGDGLADSMDDDDDGDGTTDDADEDDDNDGIDDDDSDGDGVDDEEDTDDDGDGVADDADDDDDGDGVDDEEEDEMDADDDDDGDDDDGGDDDEGEDMDDDDGGDDGGDE